MKSAGPKTLAHGPLQNADGARVEFDETAGPEPTVLGQTLKA